MRRDDPPTSASIDACDVVGLLHVWSVSGRCKCNNIDACISCSKHARFGYVTLRYYNPIPGGINST
jgi:hypothetical protein